MPFPPKIVRETLESMIERGATTAQLAAHFECSPSAIDRAKAKWGIRSYDKLTEEEIDAVIHTMCPALGTADGYREVAARFRCVILRVCAFIL